LSRSDAEQLGLVVFDQQDVDSGTARFVEHPTGLPQTPISSWGMGGSGAHWGRPSSDDDVHVVVRAMVPVEDVAGFGGLVLDDGSEWAAEGEVVVLDRDRPCEVFAVAGSVADSGKLAEQLM
jgi:hypothetical protein